MVMTLTLNAHRCPNHWDAAHTQLAYCDEVLCYAYESVETKVVLPRERSRSDRKPMAQNGSAAPELAQLAYALGIECD